MRTTMYIKARDGSYSGTAIYEDGLVTVKAGAILRMTFAKHIRGGNIALQYRNDPDVLSEKGITKIDCVFSSPSTAAQFISGSSINGWTAWHVDKKTTLRKFVDAQKKLLGIDERI